MTSESQPPGRGSPPTIADASNRVPRAILMTILVLASVFGALLVLLAWPWALSGYWGTEWPDPWPSTITLTAVWAAIVACVFLLDPFWITERVERRRRSLGLRTGSRAERLLILAILGSAFSVATVVTAGLWFSASSTSSSREWTQPARDTAVAAVVWIALACAIGWIVRPATGRSRGSRN